MSERNVFLLVSLLFAGVAYVLADGTRGNFLEMERYADFDRWERSVGKLKSLDVRLASSGKSTGYVVTCTYAFAFSGGNYTSDVCDLGTVPLLGEAAAKARAERIAGIAAGADWQPVRHGRHDGWTLATVDLPVTVRHSARYPAASTLTDEEPLPSYLYWLLIMLTGVFGLAAGLACLLCLLLAWGAGSGDWLEDPQWAALLFRDHPKRQLVAWARALRFFRFIRGSGGGMDDHGDRLAVLLKAESQQDLERIFASLGVLSRPLPLELAAGSGGYLVFEPGMTSSGIPESPEPGIVQVGGVRVVAYRTPGRLELSITDIDKPTEVTQAAVDAARDVEARLSVVAGRIIDPPQDDKHCVCPAFYPSFWEDDSRRRAPADVPPSLEDIESAAQARRNRGLTMMWAGMALVFLAALAWRDLGWPLPGIGSPGAAKLQEGVFAALHSIGGAPLAIGLFLVPGLVLLLGARREVRSAKREARRLRRRILRGR